MRCAVENFAAAGAVLVLFVGPSAAWLFYVLRRAVNGTLVSDGFLVPWLKPKSRPMIRLCTAVIVLFSVYIFVMVFGLFLLLTGIIHLGQG
jgi:hypothetical protein